MNKPLIWLAALLVLSLQAGCDRRPADQAGAAKSPTDTASSPMRGASTP